MVYHYNCNMQLLYTLKNFGKNIINTATAVRIRAVANLVKSADLICRILLTLVFRGPLPATVVARFLPALLLDGGKVTRCPYALISLCAVLSPFTEAALFSHLSHFSSAAAGPLEVRCEEFCCFLARSSSPLLAVWPALEKRMAIHCLGLG